MVYVEIFTILGDSFLDPIIHVHVPSGTVYKIQVMSPNVQIIIIFYLKIYNYGTRYQVMEHSVT